MIPDVDLHVEMREHRPSISSLTREMVAVL